MRAWLTILILGALVAPAAGGPLGPRRTLVKPVRTEITDRFLGDAISVKFRDGLPVRLRDGCLTDLGTGVLAEAADVLAATGAATWIRAYDVPEATLAALRANAQRRLGRVVADLSTQYTLLLAPGVDAGRTIDAFNGLDCVEIALPLPRPVPPPLPPDFQVNQLYENAGAIGMSAEQVWANPGQTGAGIRIADVEYSWNFDHLDLPPATVVGSPPVDPFNDDNHGTAVLGTLAGLDNGWGITGIAPGAELLVAGTWNGVTWNVGAAVIAAVAALEPGDVILIEQQMAGPNYPGSGQYGTVPVEWWSSWYDAIVTAVGNGIVVVEAAGNGWQDLDDPVYRVGNGGHWPFLEENDSGAIIVGGGTAFGSPVTRARLYFSNYGSTLDLQGWGQGVWTTGFGEAWSSEGVDLYYTYAFAGTSSAAAMVAGACALLQSAHVAATGAVLTPAEVKQHLQATGWPQQDGSLPASERIGPSPDVRTALIAVLPGPCAADITGASFGSPPDGVVDVHDLDTLLAFWGEEGLGDLAGPDGGPPDGLVNVFDLLALLAAFGQECGRP